MVQDNELVPQTGTQIDIVMPGAGHAMVRELILEYARALGVDLCFQNFPQELETLQTLYGPPGGFMLVARRSAAYVGCVGVRRIGADTCEMKRLYVRPQWRGAGIGRALATDAIRRARGEGYRRMLLDTLSHMTEARRLYASLGFRQCAAYYPSPLQGTIYLELLMGEAPLT